MNLLRNNTDTLNEVLFENRNRSYGAYFIRKSYNSSLFKALGITSASFSLLFFAFSLLVNTENELPVIMGGNIPPEVIVQFDGTKPKKITPPKIKTPTPPPAGGPKTIVQSVIGNVIKDSTNKVADTRLDAPVVPGTGSLSVNSTPGTGSVAINAEPANTLSIGSSEVTMAPDILPSFKGLNKFLSDNLIYPNEARENRIEGKVAVNFVVDEEGKIIDTKFIHKVGFGCDEEAMRVIKLMPKWKPGLMNGKPVKVSFVQVITFKLQ